MPALVSGLLLFAHFGRFCFFLSSLLVPVEWLVPCSQVLTRIANTPSSLSSGLFGSSSRPFGQNRNIFRTTGLSLLWPILPGRPPVQSFSEGPNFPLNARCFERRCYGFVAGLELDLASPAPGALRQVMATDALSDRETAATFGVCSLQASHGPRATRFTELSRKDWSSRV